MARRVDQHAREYGEAAIKTIAEIMEDPFADDRDRLRAAESMLDRAVGKPGQQIIQVPPSQVMAAQLESMSDDELMRVIQQRSLPRLADLRATPIEAEFEEHPLPGEIDPLLL